MTKAMPQKNRRVKKQKEKKEKNVNLEEQLAPCTICGRTFLPGPLSKHAKVCEKNAFKKRKVFNSLKQRVEGTDLAQFHQQTYLKKPEPPNKSEVKHNQTTWKEKHQELVSTIREAKGTTPDASGTPNRQRSINIMSAGFERCQTCDRQFGPKAYDRHVEWCKERKNRLPQSPANIQQAKERLEARIKYRVPPMSKPKKTVKEKYQSPVKIAPENVPIVKSTSSLDRRPSTRKSIDKKSTDLTPKIEIKPKRPEPLKSSGNRVPPLKLNTTQVNTLIEGLTVSQLNTPVIPPKKLTSWSEILITNCTLKPISNMQSDKMSTSLKKSGSLIDNLPRVIKSKDCLESRTRKINKDPECFEIPNVKKVKDLGHLQTHKDLFNLRSIQSKKTQEHFKPKLIKTVGTKANPLPSLHIAEDLIEPNPSKKPKNILKSDKLISSSNSSDDSAQWQELGFNSQPDPPLSTNNNNTILDLATLPKSQQHLGSEELSSLNRFKEKNVSRFDSSKSNEKETKKTIQIFNLPKPSTEGDLVQSNKVQKLDTEINDAVISINGVFVKKGVTDSEYTILKVGSSVNKEDLSGSVLVLTPSTQDTLMKYFSDSDTPREDEIILLMPQMLSKKKRAPLKIMPSEFSKENIDEVKRLDLCKIFTENLKQSTPHDAVGLHDTQSKLSPLANNEFEALDRSENEQFELTNPPGMLLTPTESHNSIEFREVLRQKSMDSLNPLQTYAAGENNQEVFKLCPLLIEEITPKRRKIESSSLDLIPEKLIDENIPIQDNLILDNSSESVIPDNQLNLSFEKLQFENIDQVIYENKSEFEEIESFHGLYSNQHSTVLSQARMERELRRCCSEITLTNHLDCINFATYSETDLTKFNRLQDVMKCSNLEDIYHRDRIWELAGEEFILTVKSLETIQEDEQDKKGSTRDEFYNTKFDDRQRIQEMDYQENSCNYQDTNQNCEKIPTVDGIYQEQDLISFDEVTQTIENPLTRHGDEGNRSLLDNILEIGRDLLQPEPSHDEYTCSEESKPFIAEIYHNCLQDNIRKIKKRKEQSSEIASQVSNQTDFKEVCNVIPEETQSSLKMDLKQSSEDLITFACGDNKLKNNTRLMKFKTSNTPSSASSTEYSPRFVKLVTVILSDNLSTRRSKDELKISREDCRRLINIDPKDLPKIRKRGNLLGMKKTMESPTSPSSGERILVLPEIVQKKSIVGAHSKNRKVGSPDSGNRDETYNPILTAERQLMELLECDDFKSFTPNKTTPQPRPKHTHSVKEINAKNLKHKRASVIDPPTDFQDSNSPDIFDENFELIENFINDNLSDDTILDKLDAISLSSHKTHLTDSEHFNAFCDELSIDPRLINEYDNLSIPEHLTIDDSSPAESIPQISNKFYNVDNKLPALEPPKAEKSVNLNEMDDLIASVANVDRSNAKKHTRTKVVKSQQSCSFGNSTSSHDKKKNLSSLKRSISVLDPVKPKNLKNKEDVQNYFQEQEMRSSPKNNAKIKEKESTNVSVVSEDLFSIDDEMYEEYKKYEQMYLLEKEEKLKQERKAQEDDSQISKISGDSAYGSLSRNKPKVRTRVAKLSPLEHQGDSASSSGSEAGIASNSATKLSKFCHECGSKYPLHTAKFCVECGVKRLLKGDD